MTDQPPTITYTRAIRFAASLPCIFGIPPDGCRCVPCAAKQVAMRIREGDDMGLTEDELFAGYAKAGEQ